MKNLNQLLSAKLRLKNAKILLEPNNITNKIIITTTQNLIGAKSENELVRKEKHCKVINTYRDGKKTGMQVIKTELMNLDEILSSVNGDHNEQPVTRLSLKLTPNNDTAF